jgi:hypothetical protein
VGNDKYNLYVRRSFDGGETWTTTPANYTHVDGSEWVGGGATSCENYLDDSVGNEGRVCNTYPAGTFEQARNLSQFSGTKETVLDPRYSPSGGPRKFAEINTMEDGTSVEPYYDDVRDPSIFFMVYETGDNTTSAEGEATPMDLFHSRATVWGDVYEWYTTEGDDCLEGSEEYLAGDCKWDWLEHDRDDLSGEASVTSNPGGTFFYSVWNQWKEDIDEDGHEHVYDSDIIFRRVWYNTVTDSVPTATIFSVSHTAADYEDEITFVGVGKDNDQFGEGVVAYEWSTDMGLTADGALSTEGNAVFCNSPTCKKPGWAFVPGFHTISFKVKDNEDNWSVEQTFTIFIAEELSQVYLPVTVK